MCNIFIFLRHDNIYIYGKKALRGNISTSVSFIEFIYDENI